MTVTVEDMRDRLLTIEELNARLATTEPMSEVGLQEQTLSFGLAGWTPENRAATNTTDPLPDAVVRVGAQEYRASAEFVLETCSAVNLNRAFAEKMPGARLEDLLNWAVGAANMLGSRTLLAMQDVALALPKATIRPYSNLRLVESALDVLTARYGCAPEDVLVDYKLHHDLRRTHMRLIVPEVIRTIQSQRGVEGQDDNWSTGIQIRNSLVGDEPTTVEGYLFAWWCTNGCSNTFAESAKWSRRGGGDEESVYAWAATAVDDVIGGLEGALDGVQALAETPIEGEAVEVMNEIFGRFRVAPTLRNAIVEQMVENDDMTMYGVMQAITATANDASMSSTQVAQLMSVGGALPTAYRSPRTILELPETVNLQPGLQVPVAIEGETVETTARRVRAN